MLCYFIATRQMLPIKTWLPWWHVLYVFVDGTSGVNNCWYISYLVPHMRRPFTHKCLIWSLLLQVVSLCCMTLSHPHAVLVLKTSWCMFPLPSQASSQCFLLNYFLKTARMKWKPITSHACPIQWRKLKPIICSGHLLVDLMSALNLSDYSISFKNNSVLCLEQVSLLSIISLP